MSANRDNRYGVLLLFGFFSGLPAALTAGTLQAWFTGAGLNLKLIGGVTLLVLPYSLRFLWAPLFDEMRLPWLDRRRGWLLLIQCALTLSLFSMAMLSPTQRVWGLPLLLVAGFVTSLFSASQDMVINAWQTEVFAPFERGLSAGFYVAGWRFGAIVSGGIALVLASHSGWRVTYLMMTGLMALAPLVTLVAPSPRHDRLPNQHHLWSVLSAGIQEFFRRTGWKTALMLLAVILTYKLGDALALALNTTFLLRKMGFSLETVGLVNKTVSLVSALMGGLAGGFWMRSLSLYRALILFAVIQAFSHVGYIVMAVSGNHMSLLVFTAFLENFCSGMGTVALLALIMDLCQMEYTATQLALFNALAYVPRVFVGPLAAYWVNDSGWVSFFAMCVIASLVPLVFVRLSRRVLLEEALD